MWNGEDLRGDDREGLKGDRAEGQWERGFRIMGEGLQLQEDRKQGGGGVT